MTRCSVQPGDRIFVKGYGFLSFAQNMGTNIGKNISKNLSGKYSQKLHDYAKKSAADALKTSSKRVIQITAEATGDLIGNKISDKEITTVELQKLQIIHNKIIQGQLQVKMIKKYLKKDTYIQKKDKRFLIILVLK